MKLPSLEKNISQTEVLDISKYGVWLMVKGQEFMLPFRDFPWFKDAKVSSVYNVKFVYHSHLHWPELDIDLELDSLKHLEKYPLVYE